MTDKGDVALSKPQRKEAGTFMVLFGGKERGDLKDTAEPRRRRYLQKAEARSFM